MLKLKEIIVQLDNDNYIEIENNLIKNKAERFLFLLQSYKRSNISDNEIKNKLGVTSNSFYVLKSRLYDKIQECLSSDMYVDQEKTIKLLLQVPELCLNTPRETSIAYLLKLDKDLLKFDMHSELLIVYSALKKLHFNSDRYYHYSQIYNKQVSYSLSIEKAEDVLSDFNKILWMYDLSKSSDLYDRLCFLKIEINNIYSLCNSRKVELIKNLIELQIFIFGKSDETLETNVDELLLKTRVIFDELPLTIVYKKWEVVLDYISFEYYYSKGLNKQAINYFEKVNSQLSNFFLYNHIAIVSNFLRTKIKFCSEFGKLELLSNAIDTSQYLIDPNDIHTQILIKVYNTFVLFNQKQYKNVVKSLNDIHNEYVFKNHFHEFLSIKVFLLYTYIKLGEFENAYACIKMLIRRIKLDANSDYTHVIYLLKAFEMEINKEANQKNNIKKKDLLTLFLAKNSKNYEVAPYIIFDLKKKYQI